MSLALDIIGYLIVACFLGTLYLFNQLARLPLYMQSIGILFALFLWGVASVIQKRPVYRHYRWNLTVLFFTLFLWAACLWSFYPAQSVRYTLVFSTGAIWLVLLSSYPFEKKHLIALYLIMTIGAVWQAVLLIIPHLPSYYRAFVYGAIHGDYMLFRSLGFPRIESSIGGSNSVGGLYTVLFTLTAPVVFFGWFRHPPRSVGRHIGLILLSILGFLTLSLFLVVVVMSGSRGSLIGVVFSLLFIWLSRQAWYKSLLYVWIGSISALIPAVLRSIQYVYSGVVDEVRYMIWQNSWEIAKLVPLTGIGLGNFQMVYSFLYNEPYRHAHNIFFNVMVELGFPGLFGFLCLSGVLIVLGLERSHHQTDRFWYGIELGLTVTVFGYLMRCLVDYTI